MRIPYLSFEHMHQPIRAEILSAFEKFYDNRYYVAGPEVKKFETAYARFNGVKNTVGVSNGLDALFLALRSLGVQKGDEVIIPSNTYIATALAVSYAGATPVFVEPDAETYNIDPKNIASAISDRTKIILPVHLYGNPCAMEEIMDIAKTYQLFVVEDNAQSHGATFKNKMTGSFGEVNATSFYPGKNLGALGEAGAITTDNDTIAEKISILRNYGSEKKYYNSEMGHNMRMDECQAAFLSVKLHYLEEWTNARISIAAMYNALLSGIPQLDLPVATHASKHVYHIYPVRTKHRNALQMYLEDHGIGTLIHYPVPIHLQSAYTFLEKKKGAFPIAERLAETLLSLPIWPGMQENEIEYISATIKKFYSIHG